MRTRKVRANQRIAFPQVSSYNPGMAVALSLIVPGAGHMYRGSVNSGLKWFILVMLGYLFFIALGVIFHTLLVIPGIVLHTICIARATRKNRR